MDSLEQLPIPKTQLTPNEESIINNYFEGSETSSSNSGGKWSKIMKILKTSIALLVLFIIIANPWVDAILCKVPYCSGSGASFGLKSFLYLIGVFALLYILS